MDRPWTRGGPRRTPDALPQRSGALYSRRRERRGQPRTGHPWVSTGNTARVTLAPEVLLRPPRVRVTLGVPRPVRADKSGSNDPNKNGCLRTGHAPAPKKDVVLSPSSIPRASLGSELNTGRPDCFPWFPEVLGDHLISYGRGPDSPRDHREAPPPLIPSVLTCFRSTDLTR